MVEYKLIVVKRLDGTYDVNGYYKSQSLIISGDIEIVLRHMQQLSPEFMKTKPTFVGVSKEDRIAIEHTRRRLLQEYSSIETYVERSKPALF